MVQKPDYTMPYHSHVTQDSSLLPSSSVPPSLALLLCMVTPSPLSCPIFSASYFLPLHIPLTPLLTGFLFNLSGLMGASRNAKWRYRITSPGEGSQSPALFSAPFPSIPPLTMGVSIGEAPAYMVSYLGSFSS